MWLYVTVVKGSRQSIRGQLDCCNHCEFLSGNGMKSGWILSSFRPRGVPGPTSKLSPRAPAQMGQRETEHEGGGGRKETGKRGNPRPSCCPAPRSGALAVGGYKRPRGREREAYTRRLVLPRGQPSRTRALDLPFIGVRRGPRCIIGDVAVC
jgi:hypothetical protein